MSEKGISTTTATRVRSTLDKIKARISEMTIKKDQGPKTNGIFKWNGREGLPNEQATQGATVNIFKVTNLALLISILGFMMTRKEEYDEAAEALDLNTFPAFQWGGYSLDSWKNDIEMQINIITHETELKKLEKLRDELSKYVSEDDRVATLLAQFDIE